MNYNRVLFMKRNNELVGVGVKTNGIKELLTLDEAIKVAGELKKSNRSNAIEFINNKSKLERARLEINNEKPKRNINKKKLATVAIATILGISGTGYALSSVAADKVNSNNANMLTEEIDDSVDLNLEEFDEILNASTSKTQVEYVNMMADYIKYFNIDFANTYKEEINGVEIKPALSWEYEIPALTIAYNNLSKKELLKIFNGQELDANTLDANYKNGTLQLFGAYVISDSSKPVKLYNLIHSKEGKAFVKKYEDLFYSIKDAKTDEEKLGLINKFYEELYADFPIDSDLRELGISHSDARALVDDEMYKLAVTPMVSAMEVMYQNYEIDKTLSDKAIEYFNDLGMCNLAYEAFEKAEFVLEDARLNEKYADYSKLSKLLIRELKDKNAYVIDDKHRDLSQLTKFQNLVNGHFEMDADGYFTGGYWFNYGGGTTTTVTHKRIKVGEWTETKVTKKYETKETRTSDRDYAVDKAGEKKVSDAEQKVKDQIDKENKEAQEKAEKEAEEKQKEQQAEADKDKAEKEKQAQEANEQVQNDIDDINDKINNNQSVNDNDYDNITFDNEHKDDNGNLDDSVKDVTTDSSGANKPLPDPKETGKDFDSKAKTESAPKAESTPAKPKEESKPELPDPNETGAEFDKEANQFIDYNKLFDLYLDKIIKYHNNDSVKTKVLR